MLIVPTLPRGNAARGRSRVLWLGRTLAIKAISILEGPHGQHRERRDEPS